MDLTEIKKLAAGLNRDERENLAHSLLLSQLHKLENAPNKDSPIDEWVNWTEKYSIKYISLLKERQNLQRKISRLKKDLKSKQKAISYYKQTIKDLEADDSNTDPNNFFQIIGQKINNFLKSVFKKD